VSTWKYPVASPPPLCPHGVPYAQRCTSCGWACPTCKRAYAPWVRECNYRHEDDWQARAGVQPGTFTPIRPVPADEPATAMSLIVPAEMTRPNCYRQTRIGKEWTEVWAGLECRYGGTDSEAPDFALVQFRLTLAGDAP
jgi:hypothetical protein